MAFNFYFFSTYTNQPLWLRLVYHGVNGSGGASLDARIPEEIEERQEFAG